MRCYKERTYCAADCVNMNCNKNILTIDPMDFQKAGLTLCMIDYGRNCKDIQHASFEWVKEIDKRLKLFGVQI